MSFTYEYQRPSVTSDVILFGMEDKALTVLLVLRKHEPFAQRWALPGGFVNPGETPKAAAARELKEETGVKNGKIELEELPAFGEPDRDPRGWVISHPYFALVNQNRHKTKADDDAEAAVWFKFRELPPLAFDHHEIIMEALARLRRKARREPIGLDILKPTFTLDELQALYEAVFGYEFNRSKFRRTILKMGHLTEEGETRVVLGRRVKLYRFDRKQYRALKDAGFFPGA